MPKYSSSVHTKRRSLLPTQWNTLRQSTFTFYLPHPPFRQPINFSFRNNRRLRGTSSDRPDELVLGIMRPPHPPFHCAQGLRYGIESPTAMSGDSCVGRQSNSGCRDPVTERCNSEHASYTMSVMGASSLASSKFSSFHVTDW